MYSRRLDLRCFQNVFSVYLVIVLLKDRDLAHGIDYGPSLTSLTGVYVSWKGPSLLAIDSGKKIELSQFPNYAVVVPLTTGSSSASSHQIFQERIISTIGEFVVQAPLGYGVMAVIQELSLRKSQRVRANKVKCSDYVQFGEMMPGTTGTVTSPICGEVKRGDPAINPKGLIGPRVFHSSSGRMKVVFNHAYVSELVHTLLANYENYDPRRNPLLRFEVAFTAFNDECFEEEPPSLNGTSTEIPPEALDKRMCSNYNFNTNTTSSWNRTCISAKLFCDDVQNCGGDIVNSVIGSDENYMNCPQKPPTTTTTTDKPTEPPSIESLEDEIASNSNPDGKTTPRSNARKALDNLFYYNSNDRQPTFRPWRTTTTTTTTTLPTVITDPNSTSSLSISEFNNLTIKPTHKAVEYDFSENPPSFFNKADITNAISSVIYGVAIFIIFTVFITVCFVCVSKKIQKTLSDRNRTAVPSTPSITPSTTTTVITHNSQNNTNGELAFAPANTTVVLLTLPQNIENYDPPPAYDMLFPQPCVDST